MVWSRDRRRRGRRGALSVNRRLGRSGVSEERRGAGTAPASRSTSPADTRPPSMVPPGESRYHKAGGLRSRLDALGEDADDLHVTVDLRALRSRTVR